MAKTFKIRGTISCKTANVIYLLRCPCGLCYVGKTSRPLKNRISEHRCAIRHRDPKSPVAQHFANSRHSVSTLQYIGIEVVKYGAVVILINYFYNVRPFGFSH